MAEEPIKSIQSIQLKSTTLVEAYLEVVTIFHSRRGTQPGMINFRLIDEVVVWLTENQINYKFNTRKGRIKFYTEGDLILFKLRWL